MSDIIDNNSRPDWLVHIAVRVDELVAKPPVMKRFRRMLRSHTSIRFLPLDRNAAPPFVTAFA